MASADIRTNIPLITGLGLALLMPSCGVFTPSEAQSDRPGRPDDANQPVAVETARAQTGTIKEALTYTGTTRPQKQIALRAQTAGEVIALGVDVGDAVQPGDLLARIDGRLLTTRVNEAQAELSVRQSEVAESQVSISDTQAAVVQAQATRDQTQLDANRLRQLADQGAISQQTAEAAELALVNAQQAVVSTQAQLQTRQQSITAALGRTEAQRAVVAETQEQLSSAELRAPFAATILNRLVAPGDYVQANTALLELGDLGTLKVTVQVSELDLSQFTTGQPAQVKLDAFPTLETISGRITRIFPIADTVSRLVTVEVTMANPANRIGSGLLARVRFSPPGDTHIVVPASALETGNQENTIFVVEQENDQATVVAQAVILGQRHQGRVEILSGLDKHQSYVVKSDQPLESGNAVRLSLLSK